MAYETPITIKKAIENIRKRHFVLPSIQREFVWDTDQIETLFDSLMRDYPISTFLFWKVDKANVGRFQFYEFLKNYHEKDSRHNQKADLSNDEDVIAILDGQQRMTSIYIALSGSYSYKTPYGRWENKKAFPKRKLYLNLLGPSDELEVEYDFQFLTETETKPSEDTYWFECGEILDFKDVSEVMSYLVLNGLTDTSKYSKERSHFAINSLSKLFKVVHEDRTLSYYLEEDEELDKVLQIFIRINSGGTVLSYSDLLLSIATAQWQEKDAREVIHEFVDEINEVGEGFSFNKDIVLKSCLVLADFSDIKFKVDNFTRANMEVIEQNWDKAASAIKATVELVSKLGYNRDNLLASNTIIPIAYFVYKNDFANSIVHASAREEDRKAIKEWLARVLLKGTFGGQPDSIYPAMRDLVNSHLGRFPLEEIINYYRGRRKSISFTEDDVENILDLQYGKAKTFCALSLLYPGLNHAFKYHQDHIHPKAMFKKRDLKNRGYTEEQVGNYLGWMNGLPNLQLLQATSNHEKSGKPFEQWLNSIYSSEAEKNSYLMQHHIKSDQSLDFDEFEDFFIKRRQTLKKRFEEIFNIKTGEPELV